MQRKYIFSFIFETHPSSKTPRFALKNRLQWIAKQPERNCDLGFSFLLLKPKAVFSSCSSEGKFNLDSMLRGVETNGQAHQQQKWVFRVLFIFNKIAEEPFLLKSKSV